MEVNDDAACYTWFAFCCTLLIQIHYQKHFSLMPLKKTEVCLRKTTFLKTNPLGFITKLEGSRTRCGILKTILGQKQRERSKPPLTVILNN